jgi:hypothetical protein
MITQAVFHHKGFALVEGRVVFFSACRKDGGKPSVAGNSSLPGFDGSRMLAKIAFGRKEKT